MAKMLDFEAVIGTYGDKAAEFYCTFMEKDDKALESLRTSDVGGISSWLHYYRVFQGFTSKERESVSEAIVKWAAVRTVERDLSSARLLDEAHKQLTRKCADALGGERDLSSLVSKALWLCYPQQVPIFDSFARRTLWVLKRLEGNTEPIPEGLSQYGRFAHTWMYFFDTYADSINKIDMKSCRYPVRVFDAILWSIGDYSSEDQQ